MGLPEIDSSLFFLINKNLQGGFLDVVMPFVTNNSKIVFLPLLLWTVFKERSKIWSFIAISLIAIAFADGGGNVLKYLIARPRPCAALDGVHLLAGCGQSFSMPSNHAANAFAFAIAFFFLRKDIVTSFFIFVAAIIGFSRVYVGVHYPSDVIVGALYGGGCAFLAVKLFHWASDVYRRSDYDKALFLLVALFSLFRVYYIITGPFDLSPDEAHYWEWARRLDWSYYSKGPMIAYLIYAGTALFGNTVFGVRIFAVFLSALSSILMYALASRLYDKRTALLSALLVQIVPLYSVYGVLLTIDSPFIFFWVLSLFLFWKAIEADGNGLKEPDAGIGISSSVFPACRESFLKNDPGQAGMTKNRSRHRACVLPDGPYKRSIYWVLLGFSIGLGLLTKYTMALFYLSGLVFFLSNKDSRKFLFDKGPYISFLISLVVFSPVIFWNARHGWVTLRHTAGQAHIADGLTISAKSLFEFLGSQAGVVTPLLFVLLFVALWKMKKGRAGEFTFSFSVPIILFFVLKSIQGKVQANWALPAYETGFIAFSAYFAGVASPRKGRSGIILPLSMVLAFAVTAFAYFPAVLHLPRRLDPTIKLVGWKDLGEKTSRLYEGLFEEGPAFVLSGSYQIASELAFYMKGEPTTYCINLGRRMNQYDLWPGFEDYIGYNALLVMYDDRELPLELRSSFRRTEKVPLRIGLKGDRIRKFTAFKCYDFRGVKSRPTETY